MRRSPADSTNRSLAAFGKLQHIRFDSFNLTEKRADMAERVMSPVLKQTCRFRGDLPLRGVRQATPCVNVTAHLIDDRRGVLLFFG